jgi:uncharacterized membrane protein
MPYCVQCGSAVGASDRFCAKCGAKQSGASSASFQDCWNGLSSRNAALLCYIPWLGWIAAVVVLASDRFRGDARARFHAFQGLYLFAAWLMVEWVLSPALSYPGYAFGIPFYRTASLVLQLLILVAWIFMLVKVSHNEDYRLPILGELADRSASEQRS